MKEISDGTHVNAIKKGHRISFPVILLKPSTYKTDDLKMQIFALLQLQGGIDYRTWYNQRSHRETLWLRGTDNKDLLSRVG